MCRLFGFRAVHQSQVHQSLVLAENALLRQSEQHRDGWGVAFYKADAPEIVKSATTACEDERYRRVSSLVSSRTVLAHIRKATAGEPELHNTHPFQYGHWVFAHNGKIAKFEALRPLLLERIAPALRPSIHGETDSECIFFLILTHLARRIDLHQKKSDIHEIMGAARDAVAELSSLTGGLSRGDESFEDSTYLTFILTDGSNMIGHQGGKELHLSTYKTQCPLRQQCAFFKPSCERPTQEGTLTHFMLASEPLQGENVWQSLAFGQLIGVDAALRLHMSEDELNGSAKSQEVCTVY